MDILGAGDLIEMEKALGDDDIISPEVSLTPLSSHIHDAFQKNKDARRESGVEDDILLGVRMLNKEYSPSELDMIQQEGGTSIYMPVGATKIRALVGQIKDILLNPSSPPFSISPTEVPELPEDTLEKITKQVEAEFDKYLKDPKTTEALAENIQLQNDLRRDLQDMILEIINEEANFAFKMQERLIVDQLQEGGWEKALGDFIDDFAVYPTAYMKGPTLSKKKRLKWVNGKPEAEEDYRFCYSRINPLDMYPDASTDTVQKGDLIEILRTRPEDLSRMKGLPGWKDEAIDEILENGEGYGAIWSTDLESERSELEKRGDATSASRGVHFGFNFHGCVSKELLEEWNIEAKELAKLKGEYVEIEAIMYGSVVAKVLLNDDPLLRRPYYTASFQNRSGSVHGVSLPHLVDPIQKVCNSSMRSLINNMALSARPIAVINIERLADDGDISELIGGDVIQITNDPHGSNSRPIEFTNVPSNANELLAIYNAFEAKADDATMIPRYSYGGQDVRGAAATAQGLAMLMESANKGLKDAIRHIDTDCIIPLVENQFYFNMKRNAVSNFSGDIVVIAKGSTTLAIKGAQEVRRNEFLRDTANPIDQKIMGAIGRGDILRETAKGLGLGENVVPNRFTLRKQERIEAEQKAMQAKAASEGGQVGLQATKLQTDAQVQMHQGTQDTRAQELALDQQKHADNMAIRQAEIQVKNELGNKKISADSLGKSQSNAVKLKTSE